MDRNGIKELCLWYLCGRERCGDDDACVESELLRAPGHGAFQFRGDRVICTTRLLRVTIALMLIMYLTYCRSGQGKVWQDAIEHDRAGQGKAGQSRERQLKCNVSTEAKYRSAVLAKSYSIIPANYLIFSPLFRLRNPEPFNINNPFPSLIPD